MVRDARKLTQEILHPRRSSASVISVENDPKLSEPRGFVRYVLTAMANLNLSYTARNRSASHNSVAATPDEVSFLGTSVFCHNS